jgi:signal transduction histidine kinase
MWFKESRGLQQPQMLEILSGLSYRTGELSAYLQEIACGVSSLISVDWSVVTLCCEEGFDQILASNIDLGEGEQIYALHGTLTGTVVQTGRSLVIPDVRDTNFGTAPDGYQAYLGIPLRTHLGEVIGTICSFHKQPRQFFADEVRIVEIFAERAATAIDNYQLYLQQQQFNQALEVEVAKRTEELRVAQVKLVAQERLAAMGEFAATIVHEIRNPLTTVMMGLNYFERLDLDDSARVRLELAVEEANRLKRLLSEILQYSKPFVLQLTELDINEFITDMLSSLCLLPEAQGRHIVFKPATDATWVRGDRDKLKQVLINIVRNAIDAVDVGQTVTWTVDNSDPGQVCIHVHNGGQVIPSEILLKVTEPFYTTKSCGTGLGLAIVKRIVEAHGGELFIQSTAEAGTTVSVRLLRLI